MDKKEICNMLIETIKETRDNDDWTIEHCSVTNDVRDLPTRYGDFQKRGWSGHQSIHITRFSESGYQEYLDDCYRSVAELD